VPSRKANPDKRSITLRWSVNSGDDVGTITWYTIEINNQSSFIKYSAQYPTSTYELTYLKPYTQYYLRINARSIVGSGLWSPWNSVKTSIASKYHAISF
jgi:hypothetical protein